MQCIRGNSIIVAFLCVVSLAIRTSDGFHIDMPDNLRQAATLLHDHCVKDTSVDEALITASVGGNLPRDPKLACYIHCLFNTAGLIHTETGRIRFDEVAHLFPDKHKDLIESVTEKCQTIRKCYFNCDGQFPGRGDGVVERSWFFN